MEEPPCPCLGSAEKSLRIGRRASLWGRSLPCGRSWTNGGAGAGPCAGWAGLGLAWPPPPHPRAAASGGGTAWVRRRSQQPRPRPLRAGGKWRSCRGPLGRRPPARRCRSWSPSLRGPPRRLPSCAAGALRWPRPRRPVASRPPPRFSLLRLSAWVGLRGAQRDPLRSASPSEAGAGRPAWSCFPRDVIPVRAALRTLPAPSVRWRRPSRSPAPVPAGLPLNTSSECQLSCLPTRRSPPEAAETQLCTAVLHPLPAQRARYGLLKWSCAPQLSLVLNDFLNFPSAIDLLPKRCTEPSEQPQPSFWKLFFAVWSLGWEAWYLLFCELNFVREMKRVQILSPFGGCATQPPVSSKDASVLWVLVTLP